MFPIWVAMVFAALIAGYTVIEVQRAERVMAQAVASQAMVSFLAYRQGAQNFLRANPGHSGLISVASLHGHFPAGYSGDPRWRGTVDGGRLFVFTFAVPPPQDLVEAMWRESRHSPTVGLNRGGTLFSYAGMNTGIALPTTIPNGAFVMAGN